jgi:hypothetical protein
MPGMGPLRVSILTSETASLLDVTQSSHKSGIDKFWSRTKRNFERNQIHSINVIVVRNNKMVVVTPDFANPSIASPRKEGQHEEENNSLQDDSDNPGELITDADSRNIDDAHSGVQNLGEIKEGVLSSPIISDLRSERRERIDNLLSILEKHLRTKSQHDFRCGKSAMQFDKKIVTQVDVSISAMSNNNACFQQILNQWIHQSLSLLSSKIGCSLAQIVRLQLPETIEYDGAYLSNVEQS